jgi:hypothetical protein
MAEQEKKPRAKKAKKPVDPNAPRCLTPECGRVAGTRGLCAACYAVARGMVKAGVVTWEALEANGKVQGRGGKNGTLRAKARAWLTVA